MRTTYLDTRVLSASISRSLGGVSVTGCCRHSRLERRLVLSLPPRPRNRNGHWPIQKHVRGANGRKEQPVTPKVERDEKLADQDYETKITGETETKEETLSLEPEEKEDPIERREPVTPTCVKGPNSTVDQEAICDFTSHASGEAWPNQVRHE
ncbi:hypothetical protein NDU88_002274 [Pleurodeles waltl]|uniref:Uncharacterized protein n=1 Tax=Pleurodeles waltl TaxID=8319 RepID=A0AAV7VAR8_PLEWA|nr:hypothetical protein NDU88_002274 [Pleurodeles waltl]